MIAPRSSSPSRTQAVVSYRGQRKNCSKAVLFLCAMRDKYSVTDNFLVVTRKFLRPRLAVSPAGETSLRLSSPSRKPNSWLSIAQKNYLNKVVFLVRDEGLADYFGRYFSVSQSLNIEKSFSSLTDTSSCVLSHSNKNTAKAGFNLCAMRDSNPRPFQCK